MKEGYGSTIKKMGMKGMTFTLSHPGFFRFSGKTGRWIMRNAPGIVNNKLNPWYKQREMPEPPKESFGKWYKKNRG